MQRPEEAGDDQKPGQAEYEMENLVSPSANGDISATGRPKAVKRNSPRQECRGLKRKQKQQSAE